MSPEGVNVRHADRIWIGGKWVRAQSGRTIELVSPDTEEVIGTVAEADAEDMDAAVAAARAAFDDGPWSRLPPPERIACLKRMAQHLHGRTGARVRSPAPGRRRWAGSRALPCP
jgi:acyl-CoA reductase-like NAD-dependent aldehyde dehydrogenase